MTFQEALNEVIDNDKVVWRKTHQFADDYDRPYPDKSPPTPWSEWTRVSLDGDEDDVEFDRFIIIQSRSRDDNTNTWHRPWTEEVLTKADILAEDWEITTWKQCREETCPDCKGAGEVDSDDPDGHTLECWSCGGAGRKKQNR